jgi:hypothetical protein
MAKSDELFAKPPKIEKIDLIAAKLPEGAERGASADKI